MKKLIVIKLGGSVITYKDSPKPKARISVIKHLSIEIRKLIDKDFNIILIHGGGSFAHRLVKKYGLHYGMKTDKEKLIFGVVTNSMLKLNIIVMDWLFRAKLKAVSLSPHTFITQNKGKLLEFDLRMIKKYLSNNQVPVFFGDIIIDKSWGCSILSGDTIVCYLSKELKADKVIFLSDVDGIYDSDPKKNLQAKLIPKVNDSNINLILKGLTSTGRIDVTGEMKGKLLKVKKNLKNIPVFMTNGLKSGSMMGILNGDRVGTTLLLK